MSDLTLAATVMLLREAEAGFEVLLLQRHARSGFMPHMWVFPGGRVEPSDRDVAADAGALVRLHDDPLWARAIGVAAVRETFEESGVWLGSGAPSPEDRAALGAGTVSLAAVLARSGAQVDLGRLRPWARWVTPEGEGRRFDASFLVAVVPRSDDARHDAVETVDSAWWSPGEAVRAGFSRVPLAPPTFWMLSELAAYADVGAVLDAVDRRDLSPVQPVRAARDGVLSMLLPGDPGHPQPGRADLPTRLDLGEHQWLPVGGPALRG